MRPKVQIPEKNRWYPKGMDVILKDSSKDKYIRELEEDLLRLKAKLADSYKKLESYDELLKENALLRQQVEHLETNAKENGLESHLNSQIKNSRNSSIIVNKSGSINEFLQKKNRRSSSLLQPIELRSDSPPPSSTKVTLTPSSYANSSSSPSLKRSSTLNRSSGDVSPDVSSFSACSTSNNGLAEPQSSSSEDLSHSPSKKNDMLMKAFGFFNMRRSKDKSSDSIEKLNRKESKENSTSTPTHSPKSPKVLDKQLKGSSTPRGSKTISLGDANNNLKALTNTRAIDENVGSISDRESFEKMVKLTILGEKELRKDVLRLISGNSEAINNVEMIIPVKLANSEIQMNVWAFELSKHNAYSHKLFLSGTGIQIIAINLTSHNYLWREEALRWLQISKYHSRVLPTIIIVYGGERREKMAKHLLSEQFKKHKVFDIVLIENPKSFEKNSKLIIESLNNLLLKFPHSAKQGPIYFVDLINSLVCVRENRIIQFSELVTLIKICARSTQRGSFQQNIDNVDETEVDTPNEVFVDSEIDGIVSFLHETGIIITFEDSNFRDVVIVDPGVFILFLQTIKSCDLTEDNAIIEEPELLNVYSLFLAHRKFEMAQKMLIYFQVIFPFKGVQCPSVMNTKYQKLENKRYWIIPSLLETNVETVGLINGFHEFYLDEANARCNRIYCFVVIPFSFFERIYVLIFNCFYSRVRIISWISDKDGVILMESETEKMTIKLLFEQKELIIYFANSIPDYSLFCLVLTILNQFFVTSYPILERSEFVECISCEVVRISVLPLFRKVLRNEFESELCSLTLHSVPLKKLCPDFYASHILHLDRDDYNIEEKIGEGAFGIVHKAKIISNCQHIAIKSLKCDDPDKDPVIRDVKNLFKFRELLQEVTVLLKLSGENYQFITHPHIIQYLGVSLLPLSLVLEFAPYGILADLLYDIKSNEFSDLLKTTISLNIAHGIKFLHQLQPPVVHRDIRSYNIFMFNIEYVGDQVVYAKVGDFGLAYHNTMNMKEILPTWQWLAPEVFNGECYDEMSDIYSLGMVLYEIFTRILPFVDKVDFIHKNVVKLSEELLASPETLAQFQAQGFMIDQESKEMHLEEFKVQSIKSAIIDGLRPSIPANVAHEIGDLMKLCWRKRISKRPHWSKIISILNSHSENIKKRNSPRFRLQTSVVERLMSPAESMSSRDLISMKGTLLSRGSFEIQNMKESFQNETRMIEALTPKMQFEKVEFSQLSNNTKGIRLKTCTTASEELSNRKSKAEVQTIPYFEILAKISDSDKEFEGASLESKLEIQRRERALFYKLFDNEELLDLKRKAKHHSHPFYSSDGIDHIRDSIAEKISKLETIFTALFNLTDKYMDFEFHHKLLKEIGINTTLFEILKNLGVPCREKLTLPGLDLANKEIKIKSILITTLIDYIECFYAVKIYILSNEVFINEMSARSLYASCKVIERSIRSFIIEQQKLDFENMKF